MRITFEEIEKSDFVILEMSEKSVGLGIEPGYAVAKKKPLIVLIKQGLELSNTMQGIADIIIFYNQPEEIKILAHNNSLKRMLSHSRVRYAVLSPRPETIFTTNTIPFPPKNVLKCPIFSIFH